MHLSVVSHFSAGRYFLGDRLLTASRTGCCVADHCPVGGVGCRAKICAIRPEGGVLRLHFQQMCRVCIRCTNSSPLNYMLESLWEF